MPAIDHDEVARLLAVYSLDALPADEVAEVEEHLADCARCQAELASLREVASLLGNSGATSPEGTWDRIARELWVQTATSTKSSPRTILGISGAPGASSASGTSAPSATSSSPATAVSSAAASAEPGIVALPVPAERAPGRSRRVAAWRVAAVALVAAFVAIVGVLSFRVVNLDNRVNQLQSALGEHGTGQLVALALADPAHRSVELTTKGSSQHAVIVILPDGSAYWVTDDLGALPPGHTYQLWALSSGKVVSLGVLGREPHNVAFIVEIPMSELMVTAEPVGGVPAPTTPVLLSGSLSE
jgi:hypothetical protein